jgi:hypothetical protein
MIKNRPRITPQPKFLVLAIAFPISFIYAAECAVEKTSNHQGPNIPATPFWQWGFRQCLPFSWTTLRGKYCQHPIAVKEVVDIAGTPFHQPFSSNFWIPPYPPWLGLIYYTC